MSDSTPSNETISFESRDEALAVLDPTFKTLAEGAIKASDELVSIVGKLKAHAGTVAQVNQYAMNGVLDLKVPFSLKLPKISTMADLATMLLEWGDAAETIAKEMRDDLIKAAHVPSDQSDALKESFKVQKGIVEAFQTLAETMPGFPEAGVYIAKSLVVPDLRGTSSSGRSGGIKSGGVVWGLTKNGVKSDIGKTQNKFSSSAYYYSKHFTEDGSTMSTDEWRTFVKSQCPEFKQDSDEFTVSNSDGSITAWCEHRMND